ncbi:SDR family NAD(P)-dependent oxidoreductase [Nocardioides sp.]|uniref:SDR family NAD(P)-dependent oxidoreductase n=1 Tax=Nocardioides sp. TaxID=35761 RepID=UPI00352829CA
MLPARWLDTALDRTVAPGFSAVGHAVRSRLPGWPADPAPDALRGQQALVTGASSGLGIATAAGLAALGAEVHLVVRDLAKGRRVLADLRREIPGSSLHLWRCDLADLDDVGDLGDELLAAGHSLDVVVHNAGALPATRQESPQGHELTMALHVLAPVALTERLLPILREGARVVLVTSGGMYGQRLRDDDPDYRSGDYSGTTAYARSKRAQVELLPVLESRWSPSGVHVHATHPGWADTPGVAESLPTFRRIVGPFLRDAVAGADTTVWLAAQSPSPAGGGLWHDRRRRPTHLLPRTESSPDQVARLWSWVETETAPGRRA